MGEIAGVVIAKGDKATYLKPCFKPFVENWKTLPMCIVLVHKKSLSYSKKPKLTVAVDGEIVSMTTPLTLHVEKML